MRVKGNCDLSVHGTCQNGVRPHTNTHTYTHTHTYVHKNVLLNKETYTIVTNKSNEDTIRIK